ncbi:hypothetical protein [Glutamicibacter sp. NPDC087344]|uniref:hypothetical protein n=1 Tax=Glutamicibacter sp. NPDC087344 TaxID=3363994 RepID=UPI0038104AA9
MSLVLRTHSVWLCISVAILCGAVAGMFGKQLISVPFLGGLIMPTQMPASVIPALLLSVVLGSSIAGAERLWAGASVRNCWAYSLAYLIGVCVIAVGACFVVSVASLQGMAPTILFFRDLASLLALWLVATLGGLGPVASVLPVGYVVFSSAFARNKSAEFFPWAWIMEPHPYSCIGVVVIVAGISAGLVLVRTRRPLR